MKLTIAIPTIETRQDYFNLLRFHIQNQINEFGYQNEIELIYECDNKEMSIGAKRQLLIDRAKGEYIVQIDDDDWCPYHYVQSVMGALESNPDCVGYLEKCIYQNGSTRISCFSNKYHFWADRIDGYDYVRTPFFKSPIKTELVRSVGCRDMRFGEDHDFAKRIYHLLQKEVFINDYLYEYRYKEEPHREKYGIK